MANGYGNQIPAGNQPDWQTDYSGQYAPKLGGKHAPQAYGSGTAETNRLLSQSSRAQGDYQTAQGLQRAAMANYQNMIDGNGPSVAEQQMQQGIDQSIAAQRQMAASGRGGNLASAQRQASTVGVAQQQAGNQAAAQLRAQEQQAAMQGLAGMSSQMAGQGLQQQGLYEQSANSAFGTKYTTDHQFAAEMRKQDEAERAGRFNRGMSIFNTASNLIGGIGGALSDERAKSGIAEGGGTLGDSLARFGSAQQARMPSTQGGADGNSIVESDVNPNGATLASVQSEGGMGMSGDNSGGGSGGGGGVDIGGIMGMFGKGGGGGGGGFSMSDERAKHGMRQGGGQLGSSLSRVPAATFEYRQGAGPPGRRAGVMAQDLEKDPLLSSLVVDTPRGKMVDTDQVSLAAFASSADQERRIRGLERAVKRSA